MADNAYRVEYSKTDRSSCRDSKCSKDKETAKIGKGELRLGIEVPSPFADDKMMTKWYHRECFWGTLKRAKKPKIIMGSSDLNGFDALEPADKTAIEAGIRKHKSTASPGKKKQMAAGNAQSRISSFFGGGSGGGGSSSKSKSPAKATSSGADNSGKFSEFCELCRSVAKDSSHLAKTKIIHDYLETFIGDPELLFKLLLPHKDIDRRTYNLKDKSLVKILARCLGHPTEHIQAHLTKGDSSVTAATFFASSSKVEACSAPVLSLAQVDNFLTRLSGTGRENEQTDIFTELLCVCTPICLKFFVRLLFHDLRMGAQAKHVLGALGPTAYDTYQKRQDLGYIIRTFTNGGKGGKKTIVRTLSGGDPSSARLLTPIKPMLAEALKNFEKAIKKSPSGLYAEIKYDGERVQLHKSGDEFKYYSRSLKPVMKHKVADLHEWVPQAFPGAEQLILDCEILLVDTKTKLPLPFGTLGKHKKAGFKTACTCLFVFDMMHYNGQDLGTMSLKERRGLMEHAVTPIECRVQLSEAMFVKEERDMEELMEHAMERGEEGIMLKGINTVYEPGKRHWFKVKKDYLKGGTMADSADLVCLGGYFGTGRRAVQAGGIVSVFLMGCYDAKSKRWKTVCKCGNGFKDDELDTLQTSLVQQGMRKWSDGGCPRWLDVAKPLEPDFVVLDAMQAPVWEVAGAEFTPSNSHTAAGISIRFPRVTRVRADKTPLTATSLPELRTLMINSHGAGGAKGGGGAIANDSNAAVGGAVGGDGRIPLRWGTGSSTSIGGGGSSSASKSPGKTYSMFTKRRSPQKGVSSEDGGKKTIEKQKSHGGVDSGVGLVEQIGPPPYCLPDGRCYATVSEMLEYMRVVKEEKGKHEVGNLIDALVKQGWVGGGRGAGAIGEVGHSAADATDAADAAEAACGGTRGHGGEGWADATTEEDEMTDAGGGGGSGGGCGGGGGGDNSDDGSDSDDLTIAAMAQTVGVSAVADSVVPTAAELAAAATGAGGRAGEDVMVVETETDSDPEGTTGYHPKPRSEQRKPKPMPKQQAPDKKKKPKAVKPGSGNITGTGSGSGSTSAKGIYIPSYISKKKAVSAAGTEEPKTKPSMEERNQEREKEEAAMTGGGSGSGQYLPPPTPFNKTLQRDAAEQKVATVESDSDTSDGHPGAGGGWGDSDDEGGSGSGKSKGKGKGTGVGWGDSDDDGDEDYVQGGGKRKAAGVCGDGGGGRGGGGGGGGTGWADVDTDAATDEDEQETQEIVVGGGGGDGGDGAGAAKQKSARLVAAAAAAAAVGAGAGAGAGTGPSAGAGGQAKKRKRADPTASASASTPAAVPAPTAATVTAACPYGLNCYRQNPQHFRQLSHPADHARANQIPGFLITPAPSSDANDDSEGLGGGVGTKRQRKTKRPKCQYAGNCYRKNPQHKLDCRHPNDSDWTSDEGDEGSEEEAEWEDGEDSDEYDEGEWQE